MKHAIRLLEIARDKARADERHCRTRKELKAARQCQAEAWECLDAIELLRRHEAELKAARKAAAKGGLP